ncbi:acetyl-CoA hydrolase/transferase family protein [Clostridium minihomine]|uniref:acetyl-CoA hydrolase/transferase family protein n=1 Tax=Clostridium minihomine TaxID=2045012 RepID=UPI000C75C616|nr:acetyl-CoA hydrolase/transferase C-terminal domain-containing protein [Clostridium minihomine]
MDWKDLYAKRKMTAEEAVARIRSGDRVVTPNAAGASVHLFNALVARKDELENVEISHMVPIVKAPYAEPGMEKHFIHNSIFVGGSTRGTIEAGVGDYTPCFFHKIPELFDTTMPVDVAIIHVSSPDEHGYCSLGVSVDYSKHAAETAKLVIAQVNENMPRTLGDCFVHVSDIDCIVEYNDEVPVLNPPKISDVEKKIGGYCAELIHDGDTLQLGIGAIPDAVLLFLKDKKDLGIHTEMFSDGVVELVEAGVINNSKKTLHKGKSIATFLMGTKRLYDYVHNNPAVEMYPVNYVNDPVVIAKNDNLVSVNSCVQIDLLGQVVSESVGPTQISGVGGQIDFVRGASMSRGGRSIIAMNSTAAGGKVSKIVPFIDEWAAVTTSRNDVHYVITEYGIAELRGHTMRDRARSLIEIAHPDFRDSLKEEFEKRFHAKY